MIIIHQLRRLLLFLLMASMHTGLHAQITVYLIPGQGSDYRIFNNLDIDSTFKVKHIHYTLPDKGMSLPQFAHALATQIDTSEEFILIGVSLGGMLATEMSTFLHPKKVILISSAKSRNELPFRYKFQRHFPIYKAVSGKLAKAGAKLLQPFIEPDRNVEKETFKSMLDAKDPAFLKRTIAMILEWDREEYPNEIVHIHGNKDSTIPIRNVNYNYLVEDGSHMMALTKGKEISEIISAILSTVN